MSTVADIQVLYDDQATQSAKLSVIEKLTTSRIRRLLKLESGVAVPDTFTDIITEVTAARFARIGNEGMKSYQQEGLAMTFSDDDFSPYMDEINAFVNGDAQAPRQGRYFFV